MQKEIFIPIYLIFLSIVFITVSFLLYLTNGKNSKLLAKKLKIGAMIITLSAVIGCSGSSTPEPVMKTCYKPAPPNVFTITQEHWKEGGIIVDDETDLILNCILDRRSSDEFSFRLLDADKKVIASGNLEADDGKFDENSEDVKVKFNKDIPKGDYSIQFFASSVDKIVDDLPNATTIYKITIK